MLHVLILFCFFRIRPLQEKVNLERVMNRLGTLITIVHFVDVDSAIWCKHCLVHILFWYLWMPPCLVYVCACVCVGTCWWAFDPRLTQLLICLAGHVVSILGYMCICECVQPSLFVVKTYS